MSQLLNDKLLDFKSIIVKSEPVDYHSDDNENGENAIINTTEIVLNNVDVVKRELHPDEENDYEAFDVNTTEPEDSADDQEYELNVEINEKPEDPGKNTIGKLHSCKFCGKPVSAKQLDTHLSKCEIKYKKKYSVVRRFQCEQCVASFDVKACLQRHVRSFHEKVRLFCDKCPKSFTNLQNYKKHQLSVHEGIKRYACQNCTLSFENQFSLITHDDIEHKKIRFKCPKCPKSSTSQNWLKKHMDTHL